MTYKIMKTDWYETWQKPVRVGVYETTIFDVPNPPIIIKAYWDGKQWWHITKTFKKFKNEPLFFQNVHWRGISPWVAYLLGMK